MKQVPEKELFEEELFEEELFEEELSEKELFEEELSEKELFEEELSEKESYVFTCPNLTVPTVCDLLPQQTSFSQSTGLFIKI